MVFIDAETNFSTVEIGYAETGKNHFYCRNRLSYGRNTWHNPWSKQLRSVSMRTVNNLKDMDEYTLLHLYADLMDELRDRELIRSSNNPVADYAEKVAVETLHLLRAGKEAKGYDAVDGHIKYEVKGRRITRHNNSRQLGVIRNLEEKLFDFIIAVIFNEDFSVKEIWKIPHQFIKENSRYSSIQNGHIFIANTSLLSRSQIVERIR